MQENLYDWLLLILRWVHITTAVCWVGTSFFFMWLDRSFEKKADAKNPAHIGELWMVHGGGFYQVEKLEMGKTPVPASLHWFKWESYWTWMSGFLLLILIFYSGHGTYLLDDTISAITFYPAAALGLFSIFGSWFFYDFLWERKFVKTSAYLGHIFTLLWFFVMTYILCKTISGRAAYIHIGGMLGTWMAGNVFMRIIPRQVLMVEASKNGTSVNADWSKNAKNRSTHNTYFSLPIIFIMLSNHFPATYGHEFNWILLLIISAGAAAIREYFVKRINNPPHAKKFLFIGSALILSVIIYSGKPTSRIESTENEIVQISPTEVEVTDDGVEESAKDELTQVIASDVNSAIMYSIKGRVLFEGIAPKGKVLSLPKACAEQAKGPVYSNEVMVKDGKLQNVLVRIIKGHETLENPPVPKTSVEIDQRGCLYVPRMIAVRAGQPVEFINSDPIFHNVKTVTDKNQKLNMAMPMKNQRIKKVFNNPEIFLQTKCSVHPWMGAYIAVVDHGFFSVTNSNGEFEIKNLAAGNYTIEAWHEVFGSQKKTITIDNNLDLNFSFKK